MLRSGSLFSGVGGLDLAVEDVLGATPAWHVENDPNPSRVLAARWPGVPNLCDITTTDWSRVPAVDVLAGGFPCQDVSLAGRRAGLVRGETRSGMWSHMREAISILRPSLVVAENVRGLLSASADSEMEPCTWCLDDRSGEPAMRALGGVLADLADIRFDAAWCGLPAAAVGAPHERYRIFLLAWPADTTLDPGRLSYRDRVITGDAEVSGRNDSRSASGRGVPSGSVRGSDSPFANTDGVAGLEPWFTAADETAGGRPHSNAGGHHGAPVVRLLPTPAVAQYPSNRSMSPGASVRPSLVGLAADLSRTDFREYQPAIERWERVIGRSAPEPLEPGGRAGRMRLSARFVEWMQGLPDGWVTDPAIWNVTPEGWPVDPRIWRVYRSRSAQLRALGGTVVPQQAEVAIRHLLSVREYAVSGRAA